MPTLRIELLSDWHIGSGTGIPGDIDRTVRRDKNGLPYLPAKTIVGIWRDRCELVAYALDNQQSDGIWQQWVEYLFGSQPAIQKEPHKTPRPAMLSVRSAHLPSVLSDALQGKPYLQSALTFAKPGIKIDSRTGYVEQDCLRWQEMMRGNLTLEACYELTGLNPDSETYKTAQALLAAGAALVERLGSKRRRGSGRCEFWIDGFSKTDALEWLKESPVEPVEVEVNKAVQMTPLTEESNWYQLDLMLETKQPLILNKRTVGNVVETLDYIPGSYLLSILSRQFRQRLGVDLSEAIATESLIITNAIVMENGQAAKPIPLCLFQEKREKQNIYNRLQCASPDAQTKTMRQGYIAQPEDQKFLHITLDSKVETHNTVDDKTQRPNEEVGGVYSYQAIPKGTQFHAALRIKADVMLHLEAIAKSRSLSWKKCLDGEYAIGRAKKDEYGLVQLTLSQDPKQLLSDAITPSKANELTVWLLSDVLLRDRRLRPTTDIAEFVRQLGDALGTELTLVDAASEETLSLFARQRRTDSWQTRWGLPRPSLVGLSAGSCMKLRFEGFLSAENLMRVAAQGIGERRVEGYGQLAFNHSLLQAPKPNVSKPEEEAKNNKKLFVSSEDACFNYACLVETEAWRDAIRRAALAVAMTPESRKEILGITVNKEKQESKPSLSQLGMLRSQISTLTTAETSKYPITRWLDHLEMQGKWTETSLTKVRELIIDSSQVWQHLNLQNHLGIVLEDDLVLTQRGQEQVKGELWAEAVQTLVDTCIRAHKRDLETLKRQEMQTHD